MLMIQRKMFKNPRVSAEDLPLTTYTGVRRRRGGGGGGVGGGGDGALLSQQELPVICTWYISYFRPLRFQLSYGFGRGCIWPAV